MRKKGRKGKEKNNIFFLKEERRILKRRSVR
jgi:hypothetical protein